MALTSTKTAGKVGSKAAKAAARSISAAARNPASVAGIANLAPDELANPGVQRVNGGPLAAGFSQPAAAAQQLAIPATTGGPYAGPATLAPVTNVAQSATAAEQAAQAAAVGAQATPTTAAATSPATKMGRIGGMLAWNPTAARAAAQTGLTGTELAAAGRAGGSFAPGALGRAGLYGAAGYIGANLLHGVVGERDGTWDDAGEGALKGGGIGAGIGSMIVPGLGTAIGGGLGAIAGGLWGAFTGNDSPSKERDDYLRQQVDPSNDKSLISLMSKYGLSTDAQHNLLMQLEIIGPTLGSRDEAKALVQQVMGNLPTLIEQDKAQQAQASRAAAMQAYLLPMMRESQATSDRFIQDQATRMNEAAARMSPSVADIYRQHAADLVSSNTRSYQAQLTQMLLAPQLYQQSAQYGVANPAADAYAAAGTGYSPAG